VARPPAADIMARPAHHLITGQMLRDHALPNLWASQGISPVIPQLTSAPLITLLCGEAYRAGPGLLP
jgi:hypothetical protein